MHLDRIAKSRVWLAAIGLIALLPACEKPVPPQEVRAALAEIERPNVVLVVVDTLRADWTTPYGYEMDTSPELQRWAERGVLFERVRAQSSWTKVSMASLFTSLWSQSHGVRASTDGLGEGARTLADVLGEAGYHTYGVQSNGWLDQSFGFQQGFERYVFPQGNKQDVNLGKASHWPHAERIYQEAQRLLASNPEGEPFFLYLHFMDVHEYAAPPEYRIHSGGVEATYLAAIRWVDSVVERIRQKLERDGLADSTIMIFASDHGEAFGENHRHGHALNVHTPVLHVPLVIRTPFPMGPVRIPTQVRNIDIAPTLLELVGVPVPAEFEGESLLPLIEANTPQPDRLVFADLGEPILTNAIEQVSVNDGAWSMARNLDDEGREFLFERELDPMEDANLVDLEPEQAERLRALLDAHLAIEVRDGTRIEDVSIDPGIAAALRAVGYLQ
jgi:choline-sulfatase